MIHYIAHGLVVLNFVHMLFCKQFSRAIAFLYLYVLLLPQLPVARDFLSAMLDLRSAVLIILALAYGLELLVAQRVHVGTVCGIAFGAWAFLGAIVTNAGDDAYQRSIAFMLTGIVGSAFGKPTRFFEFLRGFWCLGSIIIVWSVVAVVLGEASAWHATGRLQGVTGNPNDLGTLCWMSGTIGTLMKTSRSSVWRRSAHYALITTLAVLLILTNSRASLLACLGIFVVSFSWRHSLIAVSVGLLILLSFMSTGVDLADRASAMFRITDSADLESLSSGRYSSQEVAIALARSSPVFGVGLGVAPILQLGYHRALAEVGIPGAALIIMFLVVPVVKGLWFRRRVPTELLPMARLGYALLVGYLINNIAENYIVSSMTYSTFLAWTAAMMLYSLPLSYRPRPVSKFVLHRTPQPLSRTVPTLASKACRITAIFQRPDIPALRNPTVLRG